MNESLAWLRGQLDKLQLEENALLEQEAELEQFELQLEEKSRMLRAKGEVASVIMMSGLTRSISKYRSRGNEEGCTTITRDSGMINAVRWLKIPQHHPHCFYVHIYGMQRTHATVEPSSVTSELVVDPAYAWLASTTTSPLLSRELFQARRPI
jgi:hypothetical protein